MCGLQRFYILHSFLNFSQKHVWSSTLLLDQKLVYMRYPA
jgi:hypothetical protein